VVVKATSAGPSAAAATAPADHRPSPLLTVVVPVYNGGDDIVANVDQIREAVAAGLSPEDVELIVVSDGSIDGTAERLLESRRDRGIRVIHYDRNLGKGYAVKAGALASHGRWIALVDADLDLDPGSIPGYLDIAEAEPLDFAIGSKRHPGSVVHYPRSRRIASWCYQQLNRVLFRLDVRDTQVGLKVFSRAVADDVVPLLLVKRYAFDLELLAVASSLGYNRIRELPVRLEYRFSGSGVGSLAVVGALWDTAAIFYRLRILRTYERKRRLFRGNASPAELPAVTVVGEPGAAELLDYPRLGPNGEVVAVLAPGARPSGNWVSAAVPFFADPGVAAVVVPTVSPLRGPLARRVAAAVLESRLGAGSRRSSYLPGNIREVSDHPAESVVFRREDLDALAAAGVPRDRMVGWLAERGRRTVYTPDASVSAPPAPLLRRHLAATFAHGRARGTTARRSRGTSLSAATALSLTPAAFALVGAALVAVGGSVRTAGLVLLLAYAAALTVSGMHAALRFRSPVVGLLQPAAVVSSQAAYLAGFVRGISERPGRARQGTRAPAS
jgi:glycosyltransferase involved in cell wall biosynthesis